MSCLFSKTNQRFLSSFVCELWPTDSAPIRASWMAFDEFHDSVGDDDDDDNDNNNKNINNDDVNNDNDDNHNRVE